MPNSTLTFQTRVCRIDEVLVSNLGDETVMMDIDRGRYYGLNSTGTRIWVLLAEPIVIRDLCDQLIAEFSAPPEQCEQEVVAFLGNLVTRGLVQVATDEAS